jgi:hypothetical protein
MQVVMSNQAASVHHWAHPAPGVLTVSTLLLRRRNFQLHVLSLEC